jgi:urease gamma subunit
MRLSNRELEKQQLVNIGFTAQRKLVSGLLLNIPETIALLTTQILYFARKGYSVARLMDEGRRLLGFNHVSLTITIL